MAMVFKFMESIEELYWNNFIYRRRIFLRFFVIGYSWVSKVEASLEESMNKCLPRLLCLHSITCTRLFTSNFCSLSLRIRDKELLNKYSPLLSFIASRLDGYMKVRNSRRYSDEVL